MRKGWTSSSVSPTAPRSPRSCGCSTVCRSPSNWQPLECGCCHRRNSSRDARSLPAPCGSPRRGRARPRSGGDRLVVELLTPWEQAAFAQCST
jgi:hypothetical protein